MTSLHSPYKVLAIVFASASLTLIASHPSLGATPHSHTQQEAPGFSSPPLKELFHIVPPDTEKTCIEEINILTQHSRKSKEEFAPKILQQSCVRFDSKEFLSLPKGRPISLPLFPKTSVEFHPLAFGQIPPFRKVTSPAPHVTDAQDLRYRWTGRIKASGSPPGIAALVINESRQTIFGMIRYGKTIVRIRPLKNGLHVILQIESTSFPDETEPSPLPKQAYQPPKMQNNARTRLLSHETGTQSDHISEYATDEALPYTVDVLALYTYEAMIGAGGSSEDIEGEISVATEQANAIFELNEIPARFNLVGVMPAPHSDMGRLQNDLDALTENETVTELRETLRADLVSMFVETGRSESGESACGIGLHNSLPDLYSSMAFSVVVRTCIDNLSFVHEMGHNMGAGHDPSSTGPRSSGTPSDFAYGHMSTEAKQYTIMALSRNCADCTREEFLSSPDHFYPGTAIMRGSTSQDNTRVLKTTAGRVSQFR